VAATLRGEASEVVLIDGPSGAGKSTFATELHAGWRGPARPVLVRMDDIYPGWNGLDEASRHLHDDLLEPRSRGEAAGWRRHDWVRNAPAEWHPVDRRRPLIVEGCGTLSASNARLATLRIWLDADDARRKERALERDGGAFDAHWEMWDRQFQAFVERERPRDLADIVLAMDPVSG